MDSVEAVEPISKGDSAILPPSDNVTMTPTVQDQDAPSAAAKVAGIAELVEMIILALPPMDGLSAAQTCMKWKQIVKDSPSIDARLHEYI
jgi:hypothetical protein